MKGDEVVVRVAESSSSCEVGGCELGSSVSVELLLVVVVVTSFCSVRLLVGLLSSDESSVAEDRPASESASVEEERSVVDSRGTLVSSFAVLS